MTTNDQATADRRAEYIAGLRQLADLLEAHPELSMPSSGSWSSDPIGIAEFGTGQRERIAKWARLLPGKKSKELGGTSGEILRMLGRLRGLHIKVICDRDEVCERRVLGTREVTEEVPDPEALAAVPTVTRTTVVEDVEWVCRPLLADETSAVSA